MIRATLFLFFAGLILFNGNLSASNYPALSDEAKVILFTCKPGNELYAAFGHDALWVTDPVKGIDRLYNYGTFDFRTPNFYVKFIRGKLNYMLSITTSTRFFAEYNHRKIGVFGQTLNLHQAEKQQIFELLETTYNSDARYYKYDFYYDNCATRLRDAVVECVEGEIEFNTQDDNLTFKDLLFSYLGHKPWTKFGMNLILGLPSDKVATTWEYMCLPEYMQIQFEKATINNKGTQRKLVSQSQAYLPHRIEYSRNSLFDPELILSLLLLILGLVSFIELRGKKRFILIDMFLNWIGIVAGLFIFFMWVGTDHIATNQNLNSLWLIPAQLVFLISTRRVGMQKYRLTMLAFIIIVSLTFMQFIWPQSTEPSFLIICLMFALRYLTQLKHIGTSNS